MMNEGVLNTSKRKMYLSRSQNLRFFVTSPPPPSVPGLIPSEFERSSALSYRDPTHRKQAIVSRLLQVRSRTSCIMPHVTLATFATPISKSCAHVHNLPESDIDIDPPDPQLKCCSEAMGLPDYASLDIQRTKGRKPFLANPHGPRRFSWPNFNYSVSHDGDFVAIAAEADALVGCDVCGTGGRATHAPGTAHESDLPSPSTSSGNAFTMPPRILRLRNQFSDDEWSLIAAAAASSQAAAPGLVWDVFGTLWSCKEAFVKARGDGVAFELGRTSFDLAPAVGLGLGRPLTSQSGLLGSWDRSTRWSAALSAFPGGPLSARVSVDGRPRPDWTFFSQQVSPGHRVTVALGPVEDAVDAWGSFKGTFLGVRRPGLGSSADYSTASDSDSLNFELESLGSSLASFGVMDRSPLDSSPSSEGTAAPSPGRLDTPRGREAESPSGSGLLGSGSAKMMIATPPRLRPSGSVRPASQAPFHLIAIEDLVPQGKWRERYCASF